MKRRISRNKRYEEYKNWDKNQIYQKTVREELENKFSYRYPYGYLQEIPAKISVSELKKQAMNLLDAEQEEAQYLIVQKESIPLVPEFIRQEKRIFCSAWTIIRAELIWKCFMC